MATVKRILDGSRVVGEYQGFKISGVVRDSRVKYGGILQYSVDLDRPVALPWRDIPIDSCLVTAENVYEVTV